MSLIETNIETTNETINESLPTEEVTDTEEVQEEQTEQVGDVQDEVTPTEEEKPVEEVKPKAPEEYADFEIPDGFEIKPEMLSKAKETFKELDLTQEQAQKLVGLQSEFIETTNKSLAEHFEKTVNEWAEQTKTELGDKFDTEMAFASKAYSEFGNEQLKELVEGYGIGNHPAFIKMMIAVGKKMSENIPPKTSPGSGSKNWLDELYGTKS